MNELFNRLPTTIRQKIITLYLGFGTQTATAIKAEINKMSKDNDDFTLWRFKISSRGYILVSITKKQMKFTGCHSGFFAVYELEIAYNSSSLCIMKPRQKLARLNILKEGLEVHFTEHFRLL